MISPSSFSVLLLHVLVFADLFCLITWYLHHTLHFSHAELKLFQYLRFNMLPHLKFFQYMFSIPSGSLFFFSSYICIFNLNFASSGRPTLNPETDSTAITSMVGYTCNTWLWMTLLPVRKTISCQGKKSVRLFSHHFSRWQAHSRSAINFVINETVQGRF